MGRLLGHLPSPEEHVGLGPLMGLVSTAPIPKEAMEPLPAPLLQLFSDCVANAGAMAILHATWVALGRPIGQWPELPSRAWLYALARLNGGQQLTDDEGTYIFSLFQSVALVGYPRESQWAYGPDHLSAKPDIDAVKNSADQRLVTGARRIISTGDQRVSDVATAIAGGSTVVLGTMLDQEFEYLGANDVWPGVTGTVIGGHAMVGHGYRTNSKGRLEFSLRSSWGDDFADKGSAWVSQDAVASRNMSDLWIVERATEYSA